MAVERLRKSPSGEEVIIGTGTPFPNLIWVNAFGAADGDGSVESPFLTPAEAVDSMTAGSSATIMMSSGDYSATPEIVIANKNVAFRGLGDVGIGALLTSAKSLLPNVTFEASSATLLFFAESCNLPLVTVETAVSASLRDCTSVWSDAGNLATVDARGGPEPFGGSPQQTINGSIGTSVLWGMGVQSLSGQNFTGQRGRILTGGTGVVMTVSAGSYEHEFDASVVFQAPGIFFDQWSWFQASENGVNLGVAPKISVQELAAFILNWGAFTYATARWLNPFLKSATAAAALTLEWIAAPRDCFATAIHVQSSAALAGNEVFTLYKGATIAGVAATALAVTLPLGTLSADFGLSPFATAPVFCEQGQFLGILHEGNTVNTTPVEVQVTFF